MSGYTLAGPDIAHERVDDEVIAINLATGAYFSLVGAAADAWDLLVAGTDLDAVALAVAPRYGVDPSTVRADLDAFVAALVADGLVAEGGAAAPAAVELPAVAEGAAYAAPTLDKYDDMEELLLLDPIHEVDPSGWPVVAAEPIDG